MDNSEQDEDCSILQSICEHNALRLHEEGADWDDLMGWVSDIEKKKVRQEVKRLKGQTDPETP